VKRETEGWTNTAKHWLKFHTVGAVGVLVQLAALMLLKGILRVHYMLATFCAVEAAVLHNFVWHQNWTWNSRPVQGNREVLQRLLRFNFTTGALSIFGNLIFMQILVGYEKLHYLFANVISIGACSLLNFLVSHHFVFRPTEQ
jgi:putative flippase GtrA